MYFIYRMATGESGMTALAAAATDPLVLVRNSKNASRPLTDFGD
jgi:hypothetical protein